MSEYEILGPQNDGEPAGTPAPVDPPKVEEPKVEAETKVEKTEGEEAKAEGEQPHKKTGSQRARERAERETALRLQAEQEVAALKAKLEGINKPVLDPDEPKLEDFEDIHSWKAALTEHASKKAAADAEARFKAEQQRKEFEAKASGWKEADAKFGATKPDWDDAIEDLQEVVQTFNPQNAPGFPALDAALSASEIAPALKYHFGKNPDELRRIAGLDPIGAIKAMARLEVQLSEAPATKPKTTNAPPPINPLSGTATPAAPQHRRDTYVEIK